MRRYILWLAQNSETGQDTLLVISKALYGLKSSGLRWSERFSDVLHEMEVLPIKD
jgi:hypothetical protein